MSSYYLYLDFPSGFFPSCLPIKSQYAPLLYPIRAKCIAHLILLIWLYQWYLVKSTHHDDPHCQISSIPPRPQPSLAQICSSAPCSRKPSAYVLRYSIHTTYRKESVLWYVVRVYTKNIPFLPTFFTVPFHCRFSHNFFLSRHFGTNFFSGLEFLISFLSVSRWECSEWPSLQRKPPKLMLWEEFEIKISFL